ncbi:hypothetical protein [uncultured Corynebacterium sp.]|uniref:hypothetical protein n=1 Tax=uncultured Corynebacterium sp. TaxID=159447 RepID=UPI0025CCEEB2|nr:hypothetical protein [uncultured Corynebacterium sp.]
MATDPLQRARYDFAVQRYHDAVAVRTERLDAELRRARETLAELSRRKNHGRNGHERGDEMPGTSNVTAGELLARGLLVAERRGSVRAILNRGG